MITLTLIKLGKSNNSGGKRLNTLRRTRPTSRVCEILPSHSIFSQALLGLSALLRQRLGCWMQYHLGTS